MTAEELLVVAEARSLAKTGAAQALRLAAGFSLGEVGSAVGASSSTVLRWERGERRPSGERALLYGQLLRRLMHRKAVPA